MRKVKCPVCGATIRLPEEDIVFGNRVTCPECGALLEVI